MGLFVYGFSALEMGHSFAFKWMIKERWAKVEVQVPPDSFNKPRELAQLVRQSGLHGDLTEIKSSSTSLTLSMLTPGTRRTVTMKPGASTAVVASMNKGPIWTMNRLHHAAGLWHDDPRLNAWGWFVLLCSVGLMLLGATGTWMWWTRLKERRLGMMLMVPATVVGSALLVLIRMS